MRGAREIFHFGTVWVASTLSNRFRLELKLVQFQTDMAINYFDLSFGIHPLWLLAVEMYPLEFICYGLLDIMIYLFGYN